MKLNQQFFRNSPGNPSGKISITGGVNAGLYSDLSSATSYIQSYTSATITDTDLVNDVFRFTVPAGSDFSLSTNFLAVSAASISDPDGLITKFSSGAFGTNTGNNLLKNVEFGVSSFDYATGTNTINNILLTTPFQVFADGYSGIMNITGNIGTTEGPDYGLFFPNPGGTINALTSKLTSNSGGKEGDLFNAEVFGNTVNYIL